MSEKIIFTDAAEKAARSIAEMTGQDFQEIKWYMTDPKLRDIYLDSFENTATLRKSIAEEVLENLKLVRAEDALAKGDETDKKVD